MRLDKYIASSTDFSRKHVKQAIKAKTVSVDGETATDLSLHINDSVQLVINGASIKPPQAR